RPSICRWFWTRWCNLRLDSARPTWPEFTGRRVLSTSMRQATGLARKSMTSWTQLTTRARRRTDRLRSYGSVTLRVRLVTELRYGTGFYKNPNVPVVTFLSWLFDSESARGFVDQVLVKQRNAQVVEIGLPCCLPTL